MARPVKQVFDEMLVLYAIDGKRDALDHLARRWRPRHYAHARRLLNRGDLAADAVQDAWINIVKGLWRLHDPAMFPAWSYSIVTRRCQDLLRKTYRAQECALDDAVSTTDNSNVLIAHDVQRGLSSLTTEQRAAISLFYSDGLTVAEIAIALSVPEGTVKTRLFHARRTLRQYFSGDHDE
jgi:RNA polymerase sigma factor (sigma-70 family)